MAEPYPASYACPTWQYAQSISKYPGRSPMECGWVRQRLRWSSTGIAVSLTFKMSTAEFATWRAWIRTYGYDWFTIDLDRFGGSLVATDVRLTGPFAYQYRNFDTVIVSCPAEFFDGDS